MAYNAWHLENSAFTIYYMSCTTNVVHLISSQYFMTTDKAFIQNENCLTELIAQSEQNDENELHPCFPLAAQMRCLKK